jgi:hypothetical protein
VTALFAMTAAIGAGLLFVVQPMVGKMLLPALGGVPAVWNTCLVFFQAALLAGYAYAHVATGEARVIRQLALYLALAVSALGVLPLRVAAGPVGPVSASDTPVLWLLVQLPIAVGLPFVALAATAPTLQRWFARAVPGTGSNPYVLYAASNFGSLVALLGYPLLVEPYLSLASQRRAWAGGYVGLLALVAACGLGAAAGEAKGAPAEGKPPTHGGAPAERIAMRRRLRWVTLALAPSAALLGVTAFLTTDIAAIPLLWVVPLALYLASFVLVFAPTPPLRHRRAARALPGLALLVVVVDLSGMTLPLWLLLPLHLAAFFVAALVCHGELALDRPAPARLTEYYLLIAMGGALGGAVAGLLAPVLIDRVVEYPLAIAVACLLGPAGRGAVVRADEAARRHVRRLDLVLALALGVLTAALAVVVPRSGLAEGRAGVGVMLGLPAILCYTLVDRPVRFGLALVALLLAGQLHEGPHGRPLYQVRTFFGVLRVTVDPAGRFHQLVHGNTVHGRQRWPPGGPAEPLSYYHASGPAGRIFDGFRGSAAPGSVAVVGLGAGSLCAYARPGDEWAFYEVDPAVERIARNPAYFTFWRDCRAERRSVVLGDARLRLTESPDGRYGLLVLDAFSSHAIPVHLVTREALELYRRKTAPAGWVVFHVSSQHLELEPILANLARELGWAAYAGDDLVLTPEERDAGKDPSRWVVLGRVPSDLGALAADPRWRSLGGALRARVWTDDFSSVWSVVRWR